LRFFTHQQSEDWLAGLQRQKPDAVPNIQAQRIAYPQQPHDVFVIAHWVATSLTHRMTVLLWITEWGVWPSSENLHLYYKLRHAYGDARLLSEAPGHLFLPHEAEDLASFLQIAMLNGWGGYVLTQAGHVDMFFSHDEYMTFYSENDACLAEVRRGLTGKASKASLSLCAPATLSFCPARNSGEG